MPYTNYDKTLGGFGISLDIFFPTGDEESGLGSGIWSISPGIITGIIVTGNYSIWPIISYRYRFKPANNQNDEFVTHGITIMVMNSIIVSEKVYILVTPMYLNNNLFQNKDKDYGGEFEINYMVIKNSLQVGFFTRQLFQSESQSYRLMFRMYL